MEQQGGGGATLQVLLMSPTMGGHSLLTRHAGLRADADFEIKKKAEQKAEAILIQLEYRQPPSGI